MSEYNRPDALYSADGQSLQKYVAKIFGLMGIGLAITTVVAVLCYFSLISGGLVYQLLSTSTMFTLILLAAQFGLVIALTAGLTRFSTGTCYALFFGYAALTGVTFGFLPIQFGMATVFSAFLFAAVLFGCCAVIGFTTNVDLTKFRGLLMGGLLALIITTIISLFVPVLRDSLFIGYAGLLLFLALTAFDMQKIKAFYYGTGVDGTVRSNLAVYGALQLYLDFINIFLYVLRIRGRNRD